MKKQTKEAKEKQSREFWQAQVDAWRRSGMNQAEYCREHGIKRWAFYDWRRKLETEKTQGLFVEAPIKQKPHFMAGTVEIESSGILIRVREEIFQQTLKGIVECLGRRHAE